MVKKTYGVSDFTDYTAQIKLSKGDISVHFTGGALTAYGVTPATFTTSNPFFQAAIERSAQYRRGRIFLMSTTTIPDAKPNKTPAPVQEKQETTPAVQPQVETESVATVEVADRSDAVEYLKEHYPEKNYSAVKLRGKAAFEAACEECGIQFVYKA